MRQIPALAGRFILYLAIFVIPLANAPITGDTLEIKTHLFRILGVAAAILYVATAILRAWPAARLRPDAKTSRKQKPDDRASLPPAPALDAIDLALVVSVISLVVSSFAAESRIAAIPGALDAVTSLAFFSLARTVFDVRGPAGPARVPPVISVITIGSVLPALFYLCDYFHTGIPDSLGNQNTVSHYLLLSMAAPIFLALRPGRMRWFGVALAVFLLWVNWLTAARGAVVGVLFASAIVAVLTAARFWSSMSGRQRAVVGIVCAIVVLAGPALLHVYATSTDFNVSVRFLSWKYSISLLNDRFWFGYGPGLFSTSFEKTKLWMADKDSTLLGMLTVNYAHNDYVEIAVDQGVVGLAAFLFLVVSCLAPAARIWISRGGRPADQAWSIALLFALAASLGQAAFDFPYHTPAPRLLFYVLLGLVSIRPAKEEAPAEEAHVSSGAGVWSMAALTAAFAALPAAPLLAMYSASAISHVAEPQFKAGHYEEVKHLHAWAAGQDPTRSQYFFRTGLGEEQAGNFEAARASYRNALSLEPYFPNVYFHLGVTSLERNPPRAASEFYANLAFVPTPVAFHNLAAMCMALGDSGAASAVYREIARRYPDDDRARHNVEALETQMRSVRPPEYVRALELYSQNRLDLARPAAEQFVRDNPNYIDGVFLLGRILFHLGNHDASERLFKTYIAGRPNDPEGHYYLGNALYFQNRLRESLASFREAVQINPGSPKMLYNLGVNYYFVDDFRSMNDCFDTVLAVNPNVSFKDKIEEMRRTARAKSRP